MNAPINWIAFIAVWLVASDIGYAKDAADPLIDAAVRDVQGLLTNFHFVSTGATRFAPVPDPLHFGVYRGAVPIMGKISTPSEATPDLQIKMNQGVQALKDKLAVKTIIDLETSGTLLDAEAKAAQLAHVNFVSIELPPIVARPTNERMQTILKILLDSASYPIYVHCRHGQDRTGTVIGLYRVFVEGMPAQQALDEMKAYGFHSIDDSVWEAGYECYFREATGLARPALCRRIPAYDPGHGSSATTPAAP